MGLLGIYATQFVKFGHWGIASMDAYDIAFGRIERHSPFLCPCAKCLQVTLEDPLVAFGHARQSSANRRIMVHGETWGPIFKKS